MIDKNNMPTLKEKLLSQSVQLGNKVPWKWITFYMLVLILPSLLFCFDSTKNLVVFDDSSKFSDKFFVLLFLLFLILLDQIYRGILFKNRLNNAFTISLNKGLFLIAVFISLVSCVFFVFQLYFVNSLNYSALPEIVKEKISLMNEDWKLWQDFGIV